MVLRKLRRFAHCRKLAMIYIAILFTVLYFFHHKEYTRREKTAHQFSEYDGEENRRPRFDVGFDIVPSKIRFEYTLEEHFMSNGSTFCETVELGCFEAKPGVDRVAVTYSLMTRTWCSNHCHQSKRRYAGIKGGVTCVCANNVDQMLALHSTKHKCDVTCPGNAEENCGGLNSLRMYMIKGECVNDDSFTDEFIESRFKGCFAAPSPLASFQKFTASTPAQCLLTCERNFQPLALIGEGVSCMCGRMTDKFNLTQKLSDCASVGAVRVYRTLVEDMRCGNIHFLPDVPHSKTLLASYPGSGNTWTRYLLEKATGIYTGSAHGDNTLYQGGLLGEKHNQRSEFIKDHLFKATKPYQTHVVVVIRNPYRALLAYLNYLYSGGFHTGFIPKELFKQPKYAISETSILEPIRHWKAVPQKVIESGKPFQVVYFEDIVTDPIGSIRRMVNFAPNPLLHPEDLESRLACLSQDTTGIFKRKKEKFPFNPYKPEVSRMLNKAIFEVRQMLKDAGVKEELPPYEYDPDYAS